MSGDASHPDCAASCFVLLDDHRASSEDRRSRLYQGYLGKLSCSRSADLPQLFDRLDQALSEGQYAVALFCYELGSEMAGVAQCPAELGGAPDGGPALAEVLLFENFQRLSSSEVETWLLKQPDVQSQTDETPAGVANVSASVDEAEFAAALARIHAYIEAGDAYQVNYTYRLRFDAFGSPFCLYSRLRHRQPAPYGALISLPDGRTVLSLSPELFVRRQNGMLTAMPMKGTAPSGGDPDEVEENIRALAADPKNRAENLMIVDLLRNDLGRIARTGSVRTPKLFEVTRYGSVLQMTSTVQAEARPDRGLADLFGALYPCGSITGAPKLRSMQIIAGLESSPRGLYTGAIACFDPPAAGSPSGDFAMSVPIRTLVLQAPAQDGVRRGEMGVGAGIVFDSRTGEEYAECRLKADFLTGLGHDFILFETMYASRAAGCRHLERHLQRLASSARYFGFAGATGQWRQRVHDACLELSSDGPYRLRLTLNQDGVCSLRSAPLTPLNGPVSVILAASPGMSANLFLRHKSSVRARYDAAWREAEIRGAFDMLFCNAQGELTEGGRSNIFLRIEGRWYTPPLEAGVLPGVMRAVLLDDPAWQASEKRLMPKDLHAAEKVILCNALRGVIEVDGWQEVQ